MSESNNRAKAYSLWCGLNQENSRYKAAVGYIPISEARLQEDLRKYLCLRCAGFLEQVTFVGITYFLEAKSGGGPVLTFGQSFFSKSPNLNVPALEKLMDRLGPAIRGQLDVFLTPAYRESLNDLLAVRNDVAHGEYQAGRKLDPARYVEVCEAYYEWVCSVFYGSTVDVISDDGRRVVEYAVNGAESPRL